MWRGKRSSLGSRLALLWLLALAISSLPLGAQNSSTTSTTAEPLWQALLPITQNLPGRYDSYTASLLEQIGSLQTSNSSLLSINADLRISNEQLSQINGDLQSSNRSLLLRNADLTLSFQRLQAQAATLESQSAQLQTDLLASMQSITRAQADARSLRLQNGLLKIGGMVVLIAGADMAVKAFTGKDAVEWILTAFAK